MEEDTLVVLSADHGEMLGSHGLMSKNVWYEESIHIPLVMRQKGRIQPGTSHASCALGGEEGGPDHMFLCSYPGTPESVGAFAREGMTHKAHGWRGIRTPRFTYVISNGYMPEEKQTEYLYDHTEDPWQMHPIVVERDTKDLKIMEFRRLLKDYLDMLGDPFLWEKEREESRVKE